MPYQRLASQKRKRHTKRLFGRIPCNRRKFLLAIDRRPIKRWFPKSHRIYLVDADGIYYYKWEQYGNQFLSVFEYLKRKFMDYILILPKNSNKICYTFQIVELYNAPKRRTHALYANILSYDELLLYICICHPMCNKIDIVHLKTINSCNQ